MLELQFQNHQTNETTTNHTLKNANDAIPSFSCKLYAKDVINSYKDRANISEPVSTEHGAESIHKQSGHHDFAR